ncbi:unnamed protein product [Ambrosiozyma monospora]|uniref:Unnamed protein product n=1 Tax=Ambrosiozyma monospora TaxID=43982 RepID=A0A9W6YWU0_AMBMO|nr:unnamed protein product [Ambrosiozyma monospora]
MMNLQVSSRRDSWIEPSLVRRLASILRRWCVFLSPLEADAAADGFLNQLNQMVDGCDYDDDDEEEEEEEEEEVSVFISKLRLGMLAN